MINKEITFTVYKGKAVLHEYDFDSLSEYLDARHEAEKDNQWTNDLDIIEDNFGDWYEKEYTFDKWTNKGKLSKQNDGYKRLPVEVIDIAESEFNRVKELEDNTPKAQARANELANIINSANFDVPEDDLVFITSKASHSKWYRGFEGSRHLQSLYYHYVPSAVANEAFELVDIRRSNQENEKFDFHACVWDYVEKRLADHDNNVIRTDNRCRYRI